MLLLTKLSRAVALSADQLAPLRSNHIYARGCMQVTLSPGQAPPPHPFSQHAPQAAHPFMHNNAQKQAPPTRPSQEQQQQAPGGYQLRVVPPSPAFSQAPYVHSPSPQPTDVIHYYQHSMSPRYTPSAGASALLRNVSPP